MVGCSKHHRPFHLDQMSFVDHILDRRVRLPARLGPKVTDPTETFPLIPVDRELAVVKSFVSVWVTSIVVDKLNAVDDALD